MRLSILDQVPVTDHIARDGAAAAGVRLAWEAEELGYHRIWFAEHHLSRAFASTAPEIMAALALERTQRIRVGTGGILLPLYPATKVLEVATLLDEVHPGRSDIGVGRGAYDDPHYGEKIRQLTRALGSHPAADGEPTSRVWVLGAGGSAAPLAGEVGAGYAHGHFFVPHGGEAATAAYRAAAGKAAHRARTVLAVRAVTASTDAQARALAQAMLLWRVRKDVGDERPIPSVQSAKEHRWSEIETRRAHARAQGIVFGTPDVVGSRLRALAEAHQADELMINTLVSDPADRQESYRLLAQQLLVSAEARDN